MSRKNLTHHGYHFCNKGILKIEFLTTTPAELNVLHLRTDRSLMH